jgi:hypothetical protein
MMRSCYAIFTGEQSSSEWESNRCHRAMLTTKLDTTHVDILRPLSYLFLL